MSGMIKNGDGAAPQGYSTELKQQVPDGKEESQNVNKSSEPVKIPEKKELSKIDEEDSEGEYDEGEVNNIIEMLNKLEKKPKKKKEEESESSSESEEEDHVSAVEKNKVKKVKRNPSPDLIYHNPMARKRQYNPEVQAYMQKANIRQKNFY